VDYRWTEHGTARYAYRAAGRGGRYLPHARGTCWIAGAGGVTAMGWLEYGTWTQESGRPYPGSGVSWFSQRRRIGAGYPYRSLSYGGREEHRRYHGKRGI